MVLKNVALRPKKLLLAIGILLALLFIFYYYYHSGNNVNIVILRPTHTQNKIIANNIAAQPRTDPNSVLYEYFFGKKNLEYSKPRLSSIPEEPLPIIQNNFAHAHSNNPDHDIFDILNKNNNPDHDIFNRIPILIPALPASYEPIIDKTSTQNDIIITRISSSHPLSLKAKNHKIAQYYYLELSTGLTVAALEAEWKIIKTIHSKILNDELNVYIHKQRVNNKILYFLRVGKFTDFASARAVCRKLIINKQHCLVVYS